MIIENALRNRESELGCIRVGLIGGGQMGEGLVCQMELMHGMRAFVVADVIPGKAREVFRSANVEDNHIIETDSSSVAAQAVEDGKYVATTNPSIIRDIESIEIVVEATGIPEIGAQVALEAILSRKHVLQMNVETDATIGYMLRRMAESAGVVYTLTAGDEPGSTMELYDFAQSLGFHVVCAGKGKNNPLDRTANPDTVRTRAEEQMMSPKMLASFVDGTKTMVEMTSLGNAIGFVPDVKGMHGPDCTPDTLAKVFVPTSDGGVLTKPGVVDYGLGVAPGVFVVFSTDHPKINRDLQYLKLGTGPYYALFRPYHLTSLETPISIARAVLKHETTIATDQAPVCETVTVAKRDLKAGERIDGLGGFTVYGMIDEAKQARESDALPLGLAPGSVLRKDIRQGETVSYSDVELDETLYIVQLRRMQDRLLESGAAH